MASPRNILVSQSGAKWDKEFSYYTGTRIAFRESNNRGAQETLRALGCDGTDKELIRNLNNGECLLSRGKEAVFQVLVSEQDEV